MLSEKDTLFGHSLNVLHKNMRLHGTSCIIFKEGMS
jgi:hypothetical protein